jgi:hypothetical protein
MKTLSTKLVETVDSAEASLREVSDAESAKPILPGGWSRKQVLGHLVDSASNNHQRFVRAALQDSLSFPAYDQDAWSCMQCAQDADWTTLIALWASYNRYLAHVIARLPVGKLDVRCAIGSNDVVSLRFLVEDYLRHLDHHLRQIGAGSRTAIGH